MPPASAPDVKKKPRTDTEGARAKSASGPGRRAASVKKEETEEDLALANAKLVLVSWGAEFEYNTLRGDWPWS